MFNYRVEIGLSKPSVRSLMDTLEGWRTACSCGDLLTPNIGANIRKG